MKSIRSIFRSQFSRRAISIAACLVLSSPAWADYYSITDLGSLGGTFTSAAGINNKGQVVGTSALLGNSEYHAFLYNNGTMTDLGTLGGTYSSASAVNDNGQVVGYSITADASEHAFFYSGGGMTDLAVPGYDSHANGINNSGEVVGYVNTSNASHAFLYNNGGFTDLGIGSANSINDNGDVVGSLGTAQDGVYHAFRYSSGITTDLGTRGGKSSYANAINNQGQVVGDTQKANSGSSPNAFLYDNNAMIELDNLGYSDSTAYDINNSGEVVGTAFKLLLGNRAFLNKNGTTTDLNSFLVAESAWTLVTANGINDLGQIVGSGIINGETHAFLMSPSDVPPVPLPASVWFLSSGLLGFAGLMRKRKTA